ALVQLARQNGITDIHGHTLVFGEANPPWFNALPVKTATDKAAIEKIMTDYITTVVKHFGDKVTSWDVVNEPLADYDDFDADTGQIYRIHKWYQAMGSSYIIKAFDAAYKANPHALLSINEYGLEADGDRWDGFLTFLKQFSSDLTSHKIPLDHISIGFEAHEYESGDLIDPKALKNHIEILSQMGFKSQISEQDVYNDDGDSVQAQQYAQVLNACISEPSCVAWRGWTLSDKYDYFIDDDGSIQNGADGLFGTKLQPRPGFTSMQQVLSQ
ncbi:MAG TPA: endo-1,4-beta-xylanase, partial [Patescibacteria group bacterium]|nr:endo-1,4-beta-xylanase [Patescibacteria group bacterium]